MNRIALVLLSVIFLAPSFASAETRMTPRTERLMSRYQRAHAKSVSGCRHITGLPGGVLYKSDNFHGGRGRSLILSCNVYHNISGLSNTLTIVNSKGKSVGAFRMYDPGHHSYGRRYYAYGSASQNIPAYIHVGSACWAINNLGARQGYVNVIGGNGSC
jgi:hypothetical protein